MSLFEYLFSTAGPAELVKAARELHAALQVQVPDPYTSWKAELAPTELRVGLVSGDLREHPVGFFLESVLHELGVSMLSRVRLYAYATTDLMDARTQRIRKRCFKWTPLHALDDAAAARTIYDDGIHVLVDLSGHTAHNRAALLARKPAPVMVSWLGYLATSGIPGTDFILGDPWVTPEEEEGLYLENVWRLPESYQCFTPPEEYVECNGLPAAKIGVFTFGSLNNMRKLNAEVVRVWADVLKAVPNSRLLLRGYGTEESRLQVEELFAEQGIMDDRLCVEPFTYQRRKALATYTSVDLALDPWPYSGATTTCEATWMGVPTLTLHGDRFVAHCGESINHNLGNKQFIAATKDEYVEKAVYWATHLNDLATLRCELRDKMLASPLCDAPRFARHLEEAFFAMYKTICKQGEKKC